MQLETLRDLLHEYGIVVLAEAIQPRGSIDHDSDANLAVQTSSGQSSISAREPLPNPSNYVLDRVARKFDSLTLGENQASRGKLAETSRLEISEVSRRDHRVAMLHMSDARQIFRRNETGSRQTDCD
jgi:hypothetical protein